MNFFLLLIAIDALLDNYFIQSSYHYFRLGIFTLFNQGVSVVKWSENYSSEIVVHFNEKKIWNLATLLHGADF